MLPSYYKHVCQYENSLVTKFFGVHCVKPIGGPKVCEHPTEFCTTLIVSFYSCSSDCHKHVGNQVRFIVMGNLFCSERRIHRRFDLKGSSHGRTTDKGEEEIDETTTLKDLDLNFVFRLERYWFQDLLRYFTFHFLSHSDFPSGF